MANGNASNARLRWAVIAASVTGLAGYAAPVAGQVAATPDEQQETIEEVLVTGTRIRSPGLVANSPISSVDEDELNFRQPASAEDFIRELPAAVPALGPGTNNGSPGGSTVNLRGLGPERNLLLINSRRIVPFNLDGQVDTNVIPVALLERTDLVTGGASAVYGADAISGVINFILREDFEGVELNTQYGSSGEGDAEEYRVDLTLGANVADGRGNVTFSVGRTNQDPLLMGERSLGQFSLSSSTGEPSGSSAGVPTFSVLPIGEGGTNELAQLDPNQGQFVTEPLELFNFNPVNFYRGALERTQMTALGRFEIAPMAEAYGEFLFMDNVREAQLAESGTFFNNFNVPVANPFITDAIRQQICQVPDADGNPQVAPENCTADNTDDEVLMQARRRFVELGPRLNDFENQTFQYTVGLRGNLDELFTGWDYDVYFSRGEATQNQVRGNWGSLSRVQQALRSTGVDPDTGEPVCDNPANNCVPLNLFGPEGSITEEMLEFINLSAFLSQEVQQDVISASVSGELGAVRSPWADEAPIGVAIGLERREVTASTQSDQASQIDSEVLGTGAPTPDRQGSFELDEVFVELLAPILPTVTLEAGYRHTWFDVGESSENYGSWKYGGAWEPLDGLRFRGMFQRATRAPNVNELFAPLVTGLSNLDTDPCQGDRINQADADTPGTLSNLCAQTGVPTGAIGGLPAPAAGQINVLAGGNPELGPEKADTITVGFVYQPAFLPDLTLTLDYFRIEIDDQVSSPSTTDILDQCFDPALNPNFAFVPACELVGRSPTTGDLNAGDALGVITEQSNLGQSETDGIDVGMIYGMDLADWGLGDRSGRLSFALNLTHIFNWEFQANPASVNRDCVGFYSVACNDATGQGMIHETKWNLRTTWSVEDFDLSLNWRRLSSMDAEPGSEPEAGWLPAFSSIDTYNYLDFAGAWMPIDNVRVNLTVRNLLDNGAPNVGDTIGSTATNSGNTFPQFYDVIGRYFTVGLNVSF